MRAVTLIVSFSLGLSASPASAMPVELTRLMSDYIRSCMMAGSRQAMPAVVQILNDIDGDGQPEFLLDGNRACDIPTELCPADAAQGCEISFWLSSSPNPSWQGHAFAAGVIGDALVVQRQGSDCPDETAESGCYLAVLQISPGGAQILPPARAAAAPQQTEPEPTPLTTAQPVPAASPTSSRPPRPPANRREVPEDAAKGLPPALQADTDEMIATCNEVGGGGSGVSEEAGYLQRADLNGDGQEDFVQYLGGINCVGAASYWGGSAGFPASVWLSGPDGYRQEALGPSQDVPRIEDGGLRLFLHGQLCDPPRAGAEGCEKLVTFQQ